MHVEENENWTVKYVTSITAINRKSWENCFVNEVEGYDYHRAMEKAGVSGFSFGWYLLETDQALLAVIPAFFTIYDLATTSQGLTKKIITGLQKFAPGKLSFKLSCLGRPETEHCPLGFHPSLDRKRQSEALRHILEFWEKHTNEQGISLLGIKDIEETDTAQFQACLREQGFQSMTSLPNAFLDIDFDGMDGYFLKLSAATRKDMRRKLRASKELIVERKENIEDAIDRLMQMYLDVRNRSDWKFEELSPEFFHALLNEMHGKAFFLMYYHQGELIGANLLIQDKGILLDKLFFAKEETGHAFNLYFISWFNNVEYCVEHNIHKYFCGQGTCEVKRRLGCSMQNNWIFFKHKNRLINFSLSILSPLLSLK